MATQGVPRLTWGVRVPLTDGVELAATLYLPEQLPAPAPTIFLLTPYIAQTYHRQGMYFARATGAVAHEGIETARPVRVSLHRGGDYPSALFIPFANQPG